MLYIVKKTHDDIGPKLRVGVTKLFFTIRIVTGSS